MRGKTMKKKALPHLAAGLAAAALLGTASISHGDVLYDTLHYSNNHLVDQTGNTFIGGQFAFATTLDAQHADNFSLNGLHDITSVTADYQQVLGTSPADGFLIEFFEDAGGKPADLAHFATLTQNFTATELQPGGNISGPWRRYTIDLSNTEALLGAGTWWVSIVPVDESPMGDLYGWLGYSGGTNGLDVHRRGGGVAHGTGNPGPFPSDWEAPTPPFDLAMHIEGTLVPAPSALAAFALAGLFGKRRRQRCS